MIEIWWKLSMWWMKDDLILVQPTLHLNIYDLEYKLKTVLEAGGTLTRGKKGRRWYDNVIHGWTMLLHKMIEITFSSSSTPFVLILMSALFLSLPHLLFFPPSLRRKWSSHRPVLLSHVFHQTVKKRRFTFHMSNAPPLSTWLPACVPSNGRRDLQAQTLYR